VVKIFYKNVGKFELVQKNEVLEQPYLLIKIVIIVLHTIIVFLYT